MNPAIYFASRASVPARPQLWEKLREENGFNVVSTWHTPDKVKPGVDMRSLWQQIETEIGGCDYLILYAEPADLPLKGAFVEAGIALAYGKTILVVYRSKGFEKLTSELLRQHLGSWVSHPSVMVCDSIDSALYVVKRGINRDLISQANN